MHAHTMATPASQRIASTAGTGISKSCQEIPRLTFWVHVGCTIASPSRVSPNRLEYVIYNGGILQQTLHVVGSGRHGPCWSAMSADFPVAWSGPALPHPTRKRCQHPSLVGYRAASSKEAARGPARGIWLGLRLLRHFTTVNADSGDSWEAGASMARIVRGCSAFT